MKVLCNIIDPQVGFCQPGRPLYLDGAEKVIPKVADFMLKLIRAFPDLDFRITQDSHHTNHIAHPHVVVDGAGRNPDPFTPISSADIKPKGYRCVIPGRIRNPEDPSRTMKISDYWPWYVKKLEENGRYTYMIWPVHCEIGGEEHAIMPEVMDALRTWAKLRWAIVEFVTKGAPWPTESYSAVQADVVLPWIPATGVNSAFVEANERADVSLWLGFALTHCLPWTFRDTAEQFKDSTMIEKMIMVEDLGSPVAGAEPQLQAVLDDLVPKGLRVMTSEQVLRELQIL